MNYSLTITATVDDEFVDQIIDSAGQGSAYWAHNIAPVSRAHEETPTAYYVSWFENDDDEEPTRKRVTRRALVDAVQKILTPGQALVGDHIVGYCKHLDAGEIDADAGDCILQVALFGELVYG